jgi:hypothetical protein
MAVVNIAAVSMPQHVLVWVPVFSLSKYLPKRGIAGIIALTLWETVSCFPQELNHFTLPEVCKDSSFSTSSVLFTALLVDVKLYLFVALIHIFAVTEDDDHLLLCLVVICFSFMKKYKIKFWFSEVHFSYQEKSLKMLSIYCYYKTKCQLQSTVSN